MSWVALFLCFFGWFGVAPLMGVIREDLGLTPVQIANSVIASVCATIVARPLFGRLCDRFGPRRTYTALLIGGSLPVMGIGLASTYETFVLMRLVIGLVGASFVITQVHTASMFAPSVVGTATATTAGWGNMGGGAAQLVMPLVLSLAVMLGADAVAGWRVAMIVPGVAMFVCGLAYARLTTDAPDPGRRPGSDSGERLSQVARDYRIWALFMVYGACFGVELTMHNVAALYLLDRFDMSLTTAGVCAGGFGAMAIFARTLGGWVSDLVERRVDRDARVRLLAALIALEGAALVAFSRMSGPVGAVAVMLLLAVIVHMACGATYAVVPFVRPRGLGAVAGIVGAGGNAGAVAAGFLLRVDGLSIGDALMWIGVCVMATSALSLTVRVGGHDARATGDRRQRDGGHEGPGTPSRARA